MIISYGARNYFSFKDGFDISFELNSKVPKAISKGKRISNVLGVKGANGSGKTYLLKCLEFIASFTTRSFQRPEGQFIHVASFFDNTDPIEFYIDLNLEGIIYTYELSCTDESVIREAIYKKVARKTLIVERINNEIKKKNSDLAVLDSIRLKKNASIIDTVIQYKLNADIQDFERIHKFLDEVTGNVSSLAVMDDHSFYSLKDATDFYSKIPSSFQFTKDLIRKCDTGVTDIALTKRTDEKGEEKYFPVFNHGSADKPRWLTAHSQSDGTMALYRRLAAYWRALTFGGVLVMDEFDTNLHPDILPMIINLFTNPESNPKSAQFIFTSHNLEIIDHLGKYRTVLVAKVDGESFCYRLDEIPGDIIRNDRSISSLYRDGKLGGVPEL